MSTPFLAEIKMVSFNFAPKGWAFCNGQLMQINQNQALFALLGTTYGGNGQTTFALPNLQGSAPLHLGSGYTLGQRAGTNQVTLVMSQLPQHTHLVNVNANAADQAAPTGAFPAIAAEPIYSGSSNAVGPPTLLANAGGGQPHNNMPPYLGINFVIALQGIFPSTN